MAKAPELPIEPPQTTWDKVLAYTPVVMTVVATLLAGLSNSEMTAAQYERSLGAQLQSKVSDDWAFFQAKKQRGSSMETSLEIADTVMHSRPVDPEKVSSSLKELSSAIRASGAGPAAEHAQAALEAVQKSFADPEVIAAFTALNGKDFALPKPPAFSDANLRAAVEAIGARKSDADVAALIKNVNEQSRLDAAKALESAAGTLDQAIGPMTKALDPLRAACFDLALAVDELSDTKGFDGALLKRRVDQLLANVNATRLRLAVRRYDAEAKLNQNAALLGEIAVRRSNIASERSRERSHRLFFGMIAAQAAVIGATLALAARHRNVLWALAAIAGLSAITFGTYVNLFT